MRCLAHLNLHFFNLTEKHHFMSLKELNFPYLI